MKEVPDMYNQLTIGDAIAPANRAARTVKYCIVKRSVSRADRMRTVSRGARCLCG